jgi:hypothetical protein
MEMRHEHISITDFRSLIMFGSKERICMLQKFTIPKSDNNCVIKVQWTPKITTVSRRTNVNRLQKTIKGGVFGKRM